MGGPGSGRRWRPGAKSTTEATCAVDVRYLARRGKLTAGYWGRLQWVLGSQIVGTIQIRADPAHVTFMYRYRSVGEEWKDAQCPVRVVHTPCNLGGMRAWFICPAVGCGRRVAILYAGDVFACRHCRKLAYASSSEGAGDRATRRADKLRERLGWLPGHLNGAGMKPKWMRWRTYWRLVAVHDELVGHALEEIAQKFRLFGR